MHEALGLRATLLFIRRWRVPHQCRAGRAGRAVLAPARPADPAVVAAIAAVYAHAVLLRRRNAAFAGNAIALSVDAVDERAGRSLTPASQAPGCCRLRGAHRRTGRDRGRRRLAPVLRWRDILIGCQRCDRG
jgi:hypothetical protein